MKFLDFIGGISFRRERAAMHRVNGQSFIARKIGLKSSQGSETLFGTGVNYLMGQRAFPLISKAGLHQKADPGREQAQVTGGSRR